MDSGQPGKENIAGVHRKLKWVAYYGVKANSGDAQALLRNAHPQLWL
jgi:hypothetical protein